jgi:imidazolonepropionase-like amidohydrolase
VSLVLLASLLIEGSRAALGGEEPSSPLERFAAAYAIKDARIVAAPGRTFDPGTIVLRRGMIEAVGASKDVAIPYDAEVIEGKGFVIYPGFIDLFTTVGQRSGADRSWTGRGRPVDLAETSLAATPADNRKGLTPEFESAGTLELTEAAVEPHRRLGFTDLLSAPGGAIATGQSALLSLSGLPRREAILKAPVALHLHAAPPNEPSAGGPNRPDSPPQPQVQGRRRPGADREAATENPYPRVLMGAVAHLRQAMLDSQHHHQLVEDNRDGAGTGPAYDPALEALWAARTRKLPVWWEADTRDEIHRALDLAAEFGTTAVIVGGREAAKVVDRLKAERVAVVLRLDLPEEPRVPAEEEFRRRPPIEREEPLRVLTHRRDLWKERAATAGALAKAGVPFALATDGLDRLDRFPAQIRELIAAGLTADQALAALTLQAARIAGLERRLGTLEPGKLGHLAAFTAPFHEENARARVVLVDGLKFEIKPEEPGAAGTRPASRRGQGPRGGTPPPFPAESASPATPPDPAGERKPAPDLGRPPGAKATRAMNMLEARSELTSARPNGRATPTSGPKPAAPTDAFRDVATELDSDRKPTINLGGDVLIKDLTILTVTRGTIDRGSILVRDGKIAALGPDVKAGPGVMIIEAAGLVAMPGIIDTHSHIAIQGGVNEFSLSVVPEVRVKDVVTGDDVWIYRALAGGTTTARLLHGSANTIGGQDAVIKLRYGKPGRELIVKDAPQGVKFALGENVTRSRGRFPNTRMGVEAVIERAFEEARAYREEWKHYEEARTKDAAKDGPPPRTDLRLEALAGILEGSIRIHSHCYRSDEILMLLRTAERYGVKVRSLQHVLEGYKVAAEIAAHGASASTFSDWWAYKVEAFDAIPFNAALLTRAGANVCIKSDSEELIRHLNLEAAKMVKYGGVSEAQALAMITINPARELGLEHRLGSIEVGKDADIALFNGHPFDAFTRCELTLIDGEVYFQRPEADGRFGARHGDHRRMPGADLAARSRHLDFAAQPKGVFALTGANLHPVSGPAIPGGTLIVAGGKIVAIGPAGIAIPPEAQTIDLSGLDVWPGLIDAGSSIGLIEVGSLQETQDYADAGRFQPELRTSTALRPDSEHIPVTRANGVLTAYVQPSGGLISGRGCVINLNGWVPRELVMADEAALNVTIPRFIPRPQAGLRPGPAPGTGPGQGSGGGADPRARRKEQLEAIRDQFKKAAHYGDVVDRARAKGGPAPPHDPRLAALVPFARGQKPVVFHADHGVEILDALAMARELKLRAIISGGAEAWTVADQLKEAGVPVLVGGTLNLPAHDYDPYDAPYANPARLHAAGVTVVIISKSGGGGASGATGGRNLPYEAATAIAFGLPEDVALRAVTLTPARVLGVSDRVGSLEAGKLANLVVTAGHVLQPTTPVLALFVEGKPLMPESRHTRLYEKYLARLREVEAGLAPLGLERPPASQARSRERSAITGGGGAP